MILRVQQIDGELHVVLTAEAVAELKLREGGSVQVTSLEETPENEHRYMTFEEGMTAFRSTLDEYRNVYRSLAK